MLVIGEDTNENQFDYMYTYDIATKTKTRIFQSTFGAETTSPYWYRHKIQIYTNYYSLAK